MSNLFDISTLLPIIESGPGASSLIITPNRRLAAKIQAAYHGQQQTGTAWLTPAIQPLSAWVQQLWDEWQDYQPPQKAAVKSLLNSRQERLLWEQIIADDPESSPLLKPSGLAQHCQQASTLLAQWQLSPESEEYQRWSDDAAVFNRWYQQFKQRCQAQHLITIDEQVESLIEAFGRGDLPRQQQIYLLGFQDIPPLFRQLLNAGAIQHSYIELPSRNQTQQRVSFQQADDELTAAALWAKQRLAENADSSIAIVVPDLHQRRDSIERQLRKQLEPNFLAIDTSPGLPAFNLSIGQSLLNVAVIQQGLQLLTLIHRPLAFEQLPSVLHSPYLPGFEEETTGRVELELTLRASKQAQFSLKQLLQVTERITPEQQNDEPELIQPSLFDQPVRDTMEESLGSLSYHKGIAQPDKSPSAAHIGCPALRQVFSVLSNATPRRQRPSQWGQWCYEVLNTAGWPGSRHCSSLEYQQLSQWYDLLVGLSQFDDLTGSITLSAALDLIRKETQAAIFQPQTDDNLLQVLGPLEAAGLQFDHLWVMGLTDNQWPTSPAPNPLIPLELQRRHAMPHATAERELNFARELTTSFIQNSSHFIASYPCWNEDQPLRPSGLISHLPVTDLQTLALRIPEENHPTSAGIETVDITKAPPVSPDERQWIRGTSGLLKQQALCPFTAFAQYRLGAYSLEEPSQGLSALDRGNLLHWVLEYVWQTYKNRDEVAALTPEQRIAAIRSCCQKAIKRYRYKNTAPSQPWMADRFWDLETSRLTTILDRWLDTELERSNFRVFATEEAFQTELAGLPFRLRIDRVDQLDDGRFVLIDYKTGETKHRQWFSERPEEPQLPLYAISCRKPVAAITFATVNAKKQTYTGLKASETAIASGIDLLTERNADSENWDSQLAQWNHVLTQLCQSFLDGEALIDPISPQAYGYSGLAPLARLAELQNEFNPDAEDDVISRGANDE